MYPMKQEHWPWILAVVAIVGVTVIICVAVLSYNQRIKNMMLLGYEETAYPGNGVTYYHKAITNQSPAVPPAADGR